MIEALNGFDFGNLNPALVLILVSLAGAAVPLLILALSSFVKLNIVFSILRNAIGGQNIPPASLVFVLSLVLTVQIMGPVWSETGCRLMKLMPQERVKAEFDAEGARKKTIKAASVKSKSGIPPVISPAPDPLTAEKIIAAFEPVFRFLRLNSNRRERLFFAAENSLPGPDRVADSKMPDAVSGQGQAERQIENETVFTLIPAFVLTEVTEAFTIGFILYIPFLIIDLVVANILLSLGMMMINPATVSLPVKLILFVICEGWLHLVQSLMLGYVR